MDKGKFGDTHEPVRKQLLANKDNDICDVKKEKGLSVEFENQKMKANLA